MVGKVAVAGAACWIASFSMLVPAVSGLRREMGFGRRQAGPTCGVVGSLKTGVTTISPGYYPGTLELSDCETRCMGNNQCKSIYYHAGDDVCGLLGISAEEAVLPDPIQPYVFSDRACFEGTGYPDDSSFTVSVETTTTDAADSSPTGYPGDSSSTVLSETSTTDAGGSSPTGYPGDSSSTVLSETSTTDAGGSSPSGYPGDSSSTVLSETSTTDAGGSSPSGYPDDSSSTVSSRTSMTDAGGSSPSGYPDESSPSWWVSDGLSYPTDAVSLPIVTPSEAPYSSDAPIYYSSVRNITSGPFATPSPTLSYPADPVSISPVPGLIQTVYDRAAYTGPPPAATSIACPASQGSIYRSEEGEEFLVNCGVSLIAASTGDDDNDRQDLGRFAIAKMRAQMAKMNKRAVRYNADDANDCLEVCLLTPDCTGVSWHMYTGECALVSGNDLEGGYNPNVISLNAFYEPGDDPNAPIRDPVFETVTVTLPPEVRTVTVTNGIVVTTTLPGTTIVTQVPVTVTPPSGPAVTVNACSTAPVVTVTSYSFDGYMYSTMPLPQPY